MSTQAKGFSVQPKMNCPHIAPMTEAHDEVPAMPRFPAKCARCSEAHETWVCVTCGHVGCSRYVLGHAKAHAVAAGHHVAISYADCSAWCFLCDDYIEGPLIRPYISAVQHAKFDAPSASAEAAVPMATEEEAAPVAEAAAAAAEEEEVTRVSETGQVLDIRGAKATETLLLEGCRTCKVSVESDALAKLLVRGCRGCSVRVAVDIAEGIVVLSGCTKVVLTLTQPAGKIFVEDCDDVQLALYGQGPHPWDTIHTVRSTAVSVAVRGAPSGSRYRIRSTRTRTIVTSVVKNAIVSEYADGSGAADDEDEDGHARRGEQEVAVPPAKRRGHANPEDVVEHFDTPDEIDAKVAQIAALMRSPSTGEWRKTVVYTGAGISTSAKIPDYRGPTGVWTLADRGESTTMETTFEAARPTLAHRAVAELVRLGAITFVTSTNVDCLHLRSGVPQEKLAELHGNAFLEVCRSCKKSFMRTFDVTAQKGPDLVDDVHTTGRKCEACQGPLFDSIVHFTESLPEAELRNALEHSNHSDVSLVMGTSMLVSPACELPLNAPNLVIVNLQKTPYDSLAGVRVFAKTDDFMQRLMDKLGVPIPAEAVTAEAAAAAEQH